MLHDATIKHEELQVFQLKFIHLYCEKNIFILLIFFFLIDKLISEILKWY